MKRMIQAPRRRRIAFLLLAALLLTGAVVCAFSSCAGRTNAGITEPEELKRPGLVFGVCVGTVYDALTAQFYPDAQYRYYESNTDMVYQLQQGAIDAFLLDEPQARAIVQESSGVTYFGDLLLPDEYAFAFPKTENGAQMARQMSEFIAGLRQDGTLDELDRIWFGEDDGAKQVDFSGLPEDGPVVKAALCTTKIPFVYIREGKLAGFAVDLAVRFCREYGYRFDYDDVQSSAFMSCIESGYDMLVGNVSITEERKEKMIFSAPYYDGGAVVMVREAQAREFRTLDDYRKPGVVLGAVTGMTIDQAEKKYFPDCEIRYFNTLPDLAQNLRNGTIDGYVQDEALARNTALHVPEVTYLPEKLSTDENALMVCDGDEGTRLLAELNAFLKECWENGTMEEIDGIWFSADETKQTVDIPKEGENGVLTFATSAEAEPFSYVKDNQVVGYDIDLAARFCRAHGYGMQVEDMDYNALLPYVASGKAQFGGACTTVTSERAELCRFTDPVYHSGYVMMTRQKLSTGAETEDKGFFASIAESFERTFVRENRWMLIVQGIVTTLYISVAAAAAGTLLGFGVCALRRMKNRFAGGFARVFVRIMQGTPLVVFLMILFYVVFVKTGLPGEVVAIIGFAINFGAYVSEMIRTGLDAVDRGQMEAALALGYTRGRAFFRIVLPQAAQHFLPVYEGEFVSMVKMTSVVGYIAVQDLTKMSDIIRSRTFDAVFPLFATAIIYFFLCWGLTALLQLLERKVRPDRKSRKVKGVTLP